MPVYQLRMRSTVTTSGAAACELIGSGTNRGVLREVLVSIGAATASQYLLGRPQAKGITPTTPVAAGALDPQSRASNLTSAVAWGTGPTVPTAGNSLGAIVMPAAIGASFIWTWPEGSDAAPIIDTSGVNSVVIWNLTANSAVLDVTWRWYEP